MQVPSLGQGKPPILCSSNNGAISDSSSKKSESVFKVNDNKLMCLLRHASTNLNEQLRMALNGNLSEIGGNEDIIKELVKAGADINAKDKDGNRALHLAAQKCTSGVFTTLLENKDSVNATNNYEITPLLYAAYYGNKEGAELLLNAGADIYAKSKGGLTALHWLAYKDNQNNVDFLELLLKKDGDTDFVNVQNQDGATALDYATLYGRKELVVALLQHRARYNGIKTPLHHAIRKGHIELAEFLINDLFEKKMIHERIKAINLQDENGMTPLAYASHNLEINKNLILTLIKNGADSTIEDEKGSSPAGRISYRIFHMKDRDPEKYRAIISFFLENGVDFNPIVWYPFLELRYSGSSRDVTSIERETEELFANLDRSWSNHLDI